MIAYMYVPKTIGGDIQMTENEKKTVTTVTIQTTLKIPRQYMEFYDRLIELGNIGSIAEIAADGVVCYLNRIHNELSGILVYLEPDDIKKDLSLTS